MIYDVLFEACPWHTRVAVFDGKGRLLGLHYDDEQLSLAEEAVVLGRVRKISPALGAAFVDIGDLQDAFLPLNQMPKDIPPLVEGARVVARISRRLSGDKGARLDGRVLYRMPPEDTPVPSLLEAPPSALSRGLRDAGLHPVRVWVTDISQRALVKDLVSADKVFQLDQHPDVDLLESLDLQLSSLQSGLFQLPAGALLTVEVTRALTAIDVDSARKLSAGKGGLALETNLEAANEVARLCKVLDIGGSVIVDFITLRNRDQRTQVRARLEEAFREIDTRKVEIMPMSPFGIVEINREKAGENLLVLLKEPLYIAGDILLRIWRQRGRYGRLRVEASGEIAEILKAHLTPSVCLALLGHGVEIKPDATLPLDRFHLVGGALRSG